MDINEEKEPKKNNTMKIVGVTAVIIGLITGGTVLAKNFVGSASGEALSVFTSTQKQIEKEMELMETTHKNNLTNAFDENANAFNMALTFDDCGFLKVPEINLNGRLIDDKASYVLDVEDVLTLNTNVDKEMTTFSLSNNIYSVENETFGNDLVEWLSDNGIPLEAETRDMLLNTNISVISIEENEKLREEYRKAMQSFILKGKYESLDSKSDDLKSYFQISFKDEDIKKFVLEIFELTPKDVVNSGYYNEILDVDGEVTKEVVEDFLSKGKFKDFIVTVGHIDNIVSDIELFIDDNVDKQNLKFSFTDTTKLLNGYEFNYDINGENFINVKFEGEVFDEKLLLGDVIISIGDTVLKFYYDYNFEGEENYDNGILKFSNELVGDYTFTSTMTSVDSKLYFDVTLPNDYEMLIGKGKFKTTFDTDNTEIDLSNATSRLFDNSINDLMANEAETLDKINKFIETYQ